MSENERNTQQRPVRRSVSSDRRAVGTVRPRTGSGSSTRTSAGAPVGADDRERVRQRSEFRTSEGGRVRTRTYADESAEASGGSILDSVKGAVGSARDAVSSRVAEVGERSAGEGPLQDVMDKLPDNPWVKRGILIAAALIVLFILFNLVTCVAGAVSGPAGSASSQSASSAASSASAEAPQKQGVESPWTDDGMFSTGDSALDEYIKKLCDQYSTEGAKYDANAYDTYIYVSRTDYVERTNNQSPWGASWDVEYAKQYFEEGNTGNCYNYAAVIEYVLKYFGYSDAEAEPCVVGLESGAWGDHGLVFVTNKENGKRCLIDSSLSANGWMLDADSYQYDIRNIDQNATVQGNVDVLNDNDTPTRIPVTTDLSDESKSSASADAADDNDENASQDSNEETTDEEPYYEEVTEGGEEYYDEGYDESESYEDEGYYEEEYYDEGGSEEEY